ncbi:MAG: tetratricopeptide repeat protein [Phycisphaerae bacterium]
MKSKEDKKLRGKTWEQVKAILEQCFDVDPSERAVFLDRACGGNAELRRHVEGLLDSDERTTPFLDPPSRGAAFEILADVLDASPMPTEVGRYRLVRMVGSGGMGAVYAAVRSDGEFDREVAVKVIKPGMATDDILRRFRQERQTLANLDHPNIAKLLDGGAAANGSPYLVMEFIDGTPIHRYCDERHISIEQRLKMFLDACSAVQHAHRHLIVHRDLKPGNILVTRDGVCKLVDFGISTILSGEQGQNHATVTDASQRIMTPQYASPEQIQGQRITTCSDVYSLGVILYELLTGHRPYQVSRRHRGAMEQVICEVDPDLPSTVVRQTREIENGDGAAVRITPASVSSLRGTQPEKLYRRLKGDLDTIVLTAMQKNPDRRYTSVEQFADDINRYLAGLPIRARRDTVSYRIGKFVQRHKVGVAATVLLILSITAGTIGTYVGLVRTQSALARAEAQTEKATVERRKAERVIVFLQHMLSAADPLQERKDVTVRELIDQTARRIDTDLASEPEIRAAVHHTLGITYASLGSLPVAEEHLRSAVRIREEVFGLNDAHTASSYNALGGILHERGDNDEAQKYLQRAKKILTGLGLEDQVASVGVDSNLGKLYHDLGELQKAEGIFSRLLKVCVDGFGESHPNTLNAMNDLAAVYSDLGRLDDSERFYRDLITRSEKELGPESPWTLSYNNNLAVLLVRLGRFEEAEPICRTTLEISRRVLGETHPQTMIAMSNLASTLDNLGETEEAESLYQSVLARRMAVLGETHPETITVQSNLGLLYRGQGRYSDAEPLLAKALEHSIITLGEKHSQTLDAMNNLALLYTDIGKLDKAELLLVTAVDTSTELLGPENEETLDYLHNLGLLYTKQNRFDKAEAIQLRLLASQTASLGAEHPRVLATTSNLAMLYFNQGRFAQARDLLLPAVDAYRKTVGESDPNTLIAMNNLARALSALGATQEALELFQSVVDGAAGILPEQHWLLAVFRGYYGECLLTKPDLPAAETMLLSAHQALAASLGADHERTVRVANHLVQLYEQWKKPDQAAQWRDRGDLPDP